MREEQLATRVKMAEVRNQATARRSSGLVPLDLVQALLPLCVFDPVADDGAVLADVVLKALREKPRSTLFIRAPASAGFQTFKVGAPVCAAPARTFLFLSL